MRTFDYKWCQEYIDDPCFDQSFNGTERPDMRSFILNFNNVALRFGDRGLFLFIPRADTVYEAHTLFKDTGKFQDDADEAFAHIFLALGAEYVTTVIPHEIKHARVAAKRVGFKLFEEGPHMDTYAVDRWDWALSSKTNQKLGKEFHSKLHEQLGKENHPEHKENNQMAGMLWRALAMQNLEMVGLYNAWAETAGFYQLRILNHYPVVLDVGDGLIAVKPDASDFEVCT